DMAVAPGQANASSIPSPRPLPPGRVCSSALSPALVPLERLLEQGPLLAAVRLDPPPHGEHGGASPVERRHARTREPFEPSGGVLPGRTVLPGRAATTPRPRVPPLAARGTRTGLLSHVCANRRRPGLPARDCGREGGGPPRRAGRTRRSACRP